MLDYDIIQFVKIQLTLPDKLDPADEMSWQHYLYSKLGSKKGTTEMIKPQQVDEVADRILAMAKVLYGLHMVNNLIIRSVIDYNILKYNNIIRKIVISRLCLLMRQI
jgi:ryanodine receptor 2